MMAIRLLGMLFLFVSAAFAQTSRTFHVTAVPNTAALNEIATILRTVGGMQNVHNDAALFNITVTGTDADIAFADWFVKQVDIANPDPAAGSYTIPGGKEMVRILYTAHNPMPALLNEMVTTVRVICDVQRIFTYSPANAIVLRTTAPRAELAGWLVHQVDVAPDDKTRWQQPHETPAADIPGEVVKVMYLVHPTPQKDFNSMIVTLRTVADIRPIFSRSIPQGIAIRTTPAQAQFADWLFQQLDVQPDDQMRAEKHEYTLRGVNDGVARVYYLKSGTTLDQLNEMAVTVRQESGVEKIFACPYNAALALRGTADAMASADRIIRQ